MIDDELVITVRIRLTPEQATTLSRLNSDSLQDVLFGRAFGAGAIPGVLAGVEITMPTFEPFPDQSSEPTPTSA